MSLAKQLEQEGQQKIDERIKGIKFEVNLEGYEGVKKDQKIATRMTIAPNVEELKTNVILRKTGATFDNLALAIQASPELKKTYKVVSEIERILDDIIDSVNKAHKTDIFVTTSRIIDETSVGKVSHNFMFKMKSTPGAPAFLEVVRLSGDNRCASCETNTGVSTPHNVVTAAHGRTAMDLALNTVLAGGLDLASKSSKLYGHMQGLIASTKKSAPLPTKGEFQKQCATCEGNASAYPHADYLAKQSLMQRPLGATAPGLGTAPPHRMDKQFDTITPKARQEITYKRIENLINAFPGHIRSKKYATSTPIGTLRTDPGELANFLTELRKELRTLVT